MSAGVTLSLEKKRRMVDMLWPCCVNACAEWNLCQGNKTATKSLRCWKLSHSPCFGPDETCQMFVPPENDLSSVAFKAGWSICMLLFLKILVQSFTPCFLVFFILLSAPGYRKIFLPLCLLMFQHICSRTRHLSYFLWFFFPKVIFSAISLIFILPSSSSVISLWER